jgi:hypothetical protein
VLLEFPMDDAASGEREDALVEMGFYVPKEAEGFAGAGDDTSAKARAAAAPPGAAPRPRRGGGACLERALGRARNWHAPLPGRTAA